MEAIGKITDISIDYKTKTPRVVFELEKSAEEIAKLRDMKLTLNIKKYRRKRSLDANAYAWELIGKIADLLRADKNEIYFDLLKRYGQRTYVSIIAEVDVTGYFKYFSYVGESKIKGRSFKHYFVYKGSSEFDSREMSIFIDGIIFEAKAMGIETRTPDEIARMKAYYD